MSHRSIFTYTFTVPQSVIDENGHVNNVAYVQWMQDAAAIHHPGAVGYKPSENTTWYAHEHRIEYLLPAFLGEEIEIRTWISEIRRVRVRRKYEFIRKSDGRVVAKGETDWVYVDAVTGRPISIPEELQFLFPVLADQTDSTARAKGVVYDEEI